MNQNESLIMTTPSDREISWTRVFEAPRHLVFDAHSRPELIRRWLLGPDGWAMPICEVDFRVGGKYRYVWRHAEKGEMGIGGEFLEIVRPEKIVSTEKFDQSWYPGEAVGTAILSEYNGKTTLTMTMLYETKEARDAVLMSPMEQGLSAGYDRLDKILAEIS